MIAIPDLPAVRNARKNVFALGIAVFGDFGQYATNPIGGFAEVSNFLAASNPSEIDLQSIAWIGDDNFSNPVCSFSFTLTEPFTAHRTTLRLCVCSTNRAKTPLSPSRKQISP